MSNFGMHTPPRAPEPLFDAADTAPARCTSCGATHPRDCEHNREREIGAVSVTRRRPRTCLNAYDPATAEIPY